MIFHFYLFWSSHFGPFLWAMPCIIYTWVIKIWGFPFGGLKPWPNWLKAMAGLVHEEPHLKSLWHCCPFSQPCIHTFLIGDLKGFSKQWASTWSLLLAQQRSKRCMGSNLPSLYLFIFLWEKKGFIGVFIDLTHLNQNLHMA